MNPPGTTKVAISPSTIKTIASMRTGAIAGLVPARGTRKRRTRRGVYPRRVRRAWVRIGGPALFVSGSVVMVAVAGIPTAKDRLLVWLLLGLIAFSLVDARRLLPRLVLEWSPFIGFLLAYDLLRGVADSAFEAHVYPICASTSGCSAAASRRSGSRIGSGTARRTSAGGTTSRGSST